jgi:RNA polymerase sigma factor (sigma-70 family)
LESINKDNNAPNESSLDFYCRIADGITVTVTLDEYLKENPDKNEVDFLKLKEFLENDYLHIERNNGAYWKIIKALSKQSVLIQNEPSAEDEFINGVNMNEDDKQHQQLVELSNSVMDRLTERQRRRYRLYHVEGLTTREIAKHDDVNQSKIVKSLRQAKKRINVIISNWPQYIMLPENKTEKK